MVGLDNTDPLFLQVKEASLPCSSHTWARAPSPTRASGVVEGQQLIQAASDIFLGWEHVIGYDGLPHDHYIRQLWDWKASAQIDTMTPEPLDVYGEICGWTLARAHARSGDRVAIAAYLGRSAVFDDALARFASLYAEQNDLDHRSLATAIAAGRLTAEIES